MEAITAIIDQSDKPDLKAAMTNVRDQVNQGTSLSEARRLLRSAKALDLMVEWVSCWAGGGGGSAAEATMGLRALTHSDVVFSVPARGVHCATISELLEFRKGVQHRLGECE